MSNTTYRYLHIKDVVPVGEYAWNATARYLIHPNSKYGGYALKFQDLIDHAVSVGDYGALRRLMTSEPVMPEFDRLNDDVRGMVMKSIKKREKSAYAIMIADRNSENSLVRVVDSMSRCHTVVRVASRRETRPHVVSFIENNYGKELEMARAILR